MKKILVVILTICLAASAFCFPAFAADSIVLDVSGLKKNGDLVSLNHWTTFAEGWEAAVDFAEDEDFMEEHGYTRIVVDLRADWKADDDGVFGKSSWDGFQYSTIYVPDNVRMTINMNGHTIDRGLDDNEDDGEVIYVDEGAHLIINGGKSDDDVTRGDEANATVQFGTITGGNSDNGAGGIHINGAHVELKNVKVTGNIADDDDGAGIAAYNNATVVMKGGSLSDNILDGTWGTLNCAGGGIYAKDSTVTLEKVLITNNQTIDSFGDGMAVYSNGSNVTIDQCLIDGNGVGAPEESKFHVGSSVIQLKSSHASITKTTFINNGAPYGDSAVIWLDRNVDLDMDECVFKNNAPKVLFVVKSSINPTNNFFIKNSTVVDNQSAVFDGLFESGCFENCTFNNNEYLGNFIYDFEVWGSSLLIFRNCSLGDSDYAEYSAEKMEFQDAEGNVLGASIFGEGSMSMLVSLAALVSGIASIGISIANKKKPASKSEEE